MCKYINITLLEYILNCMYKKMTPDPMWDWNKNSGKQYESITRWPLHLLHRHHPSRSSQTRAAAQIPTAEKKKGQLKSSLASQKSHLGI